MINKSEYISCPKCGSKDSVVKHGYLKSKKPRFRCFFCKISYSSDRDTFAIKGSLMSWLSIYGVRGTARKIGVAPSTILNWRKDLNKTTVAQTQSSPYHHQHYSHKNVIYRG